VPARTAAAPLASALVSFMTRLFYDRQIYGKASSITRQVIPHDCMAESHSYHHLMLVTIYRLPIRRTQYRRQLLSSSRAACAYGLLPSEVNIRLKFLRYRFIDFQLRETPLSPPSAMMKCLALSSNIYRS